MKFSLILKNEESMMRKDLKVFRKMTKDKGGSNSKRAIHSSISFNFINNSISNKSISHLCLITLMCCSWICRKSDPFTNAKKSGLFISSTQNCKSVNKVKTSTSLLLKSCTAS